MPTEIFNDDFTDTAETTLTSHTPTPTGTAWIAEEIPDTFLEIKAGNKMRPDAAFSSSRVVYTCTPLPSTPDYDVQLTIPNVKASGTDDPWGVLARHTGGSDGDFYAGGGYPQAAAADTKIWKKTGGASPVRTEIASADIGIVSTDKMRFDVRTDSQELFHDSGGGFSSVLSATNDDSADGLDGAGRYGFAMGNFTNNSADDVNNAWGFDDFIGTEQGAAVIFTILGPHAYPMPPYGSFIGKKEGLLVTIGQATETDVAFGVQPNKDIPVGQALETDIGFVVTPGQSRIVAILQAIETDVANPLNVAKTKTLGLAGEADVGFVVRPVRLVPVGLASEADTANVVRPNRAILIGLAGETDIANPLANIIKTVTLGLASESDIAFGVTPFLAGGPPAPKSYGILRRRRRRM